MRVLFIGDVFGRPGRKALESQLGYLKSFYGADFCIANAENAAAGKGITYDVAQELYAAGVDIITLGNHAWDNKDVFSFIDDDRRIVRAYNYPPGVPGRGFTTFETPLGTKITIAQIFARLFMLNVDCPFRGADNLLRETGDDHILILDLHGEATSEKVALGWYLDGRVTAVIGTHTHIPTADERILPKGTAYITDVGMTGPYDSVIGMEIETATERFLTTLKKPFKVATENVKISGVLITVDDLTKKAVSIERLLVDVADNSPANVS